MSLKHLAPLAAVLLVSAAACNDARDAEASPPADAPAAEAPAIPSTGNIITVELITDGAGNFFKPAEVQAHRGDIIRYVLTAGVHNVNFVADSNPGATNLPPVGPLLQLPGQTFDVPVNFAPGRYYFHCDPHALLGMIGHVTVTE